MKIELSRIIIDQQMIELATECRGLKKNICYNVALGCPTKAYVLKAWCFEKKSDL